MGSGRFWLGVGDERLRLGVGDERLRLGLGSGLGLWCVYSEIKDRSCG